MKTRFVAILCVPFACATTAQAVEVTGGSVGLSFSGFTRDLDTNRLGVEGSVELGFNRSWAAQFDLAHNRFGESDSDVTSFGLHGIYHVNAATSFGGFYTREEADGEDYDIFGVEAGHDFANWATEAYIGLADSSLGDDAELFGINGRTELQNGFGFGAGFHSIDIDGAKIERLSVSLDRDVGTNVNLYLEVGAARISVPGDSDTEPFLGLGGTYHFGAERGATFRVRNLGNILPGG